MSIAFLASPMDYAFKDELREGGIREGTPVQLDIWRQQARHRLERIGVMVYDPAGAWHGTRQGQLDPRIERVNNMAMGRADLLFALLPPGIRSIGVPMEIERAMLNSIPVYVAGGKGSQALANYVDRPGFVWSPEGDIDKLVEHVRLDTADGRWVQPPRKPDVLAVQDLSGVAFQANFLPRQHHHDDAGFDLWVSEHTTIKPGESVDVPMGIAVELPPDTWGLLIARSSALRMRSLDVKTAVIDGGYRGPLFAYVTNPTDHYVGISVGERLAQLIPIGMRSHMMQPKWVSELRPSERGQDGFGSTGR